MQKVRKSNIAFLILILLCIPYMGDIGRIVFSSMGKKYYVLLACICICDIVLTSLVRVVIIIDDYKKKLVQKLLIVAITMLSTLMLGNTLDNAFLGIILLLFYYYFANIDVTNEFLKRVGKGAIIFLYLEGILTLLADERLSYFNPNSYAVFSVVMFMFSTLYVKEIKPTWWKCIIALANTVVTFYLCFIAYKSETQLLSLALFAILILFGRWNAIKASIMRFILVCVLAFIVLLPLITAWLVDLNVLSVSAFSNRGYRWTTTLQELNRVGMFRVSNANIGAHNGVLDICLKYGVFATVIFEVIFFGTVIKKARLVKNDTKCETLMCMVISLVFMNSVEAFFFGLTDAYPLIIIMAWISKRTYENRTREVKS